MGPGFDDFSGDHIEPDPELSGSDGYDSDSDNEAGSDDED